MHKGKLASIAELRDESDRDGMRVVLTVKPGHEVGAVIQQLYEQTPLPIQFHVSFLALIDGRPQQCSLRRLLQEFLTFREATLQRPHARIPGSGGANPAFAGMTHGDDPSGCVDTPTA